MNITRSFGAHKELTAQIDKPVTSYHKHKYEGCTPSSWCQHLFCSPVFICYLCFRKQFLQKPVWDGELELGNEDLGVVGGWGCEQLTCWQPLVEAPGIIRAGMSSV